MTLSLTIKLMEQSDLPAVMSIQGETKLSPWSREAYRQAIEDQDFLAYVARESGSVQGFLLARLITSGESCEILNIAISLTYQRQAIGGSLLARLFSDIFPQIDTVFLEVRKGNAPAIAFYKKHGFYEVGRRKNYYSDPVENALIMEKKLN